MLISASEVHVREVHGVAPQPQEASPQMSNCIGNVRTCRCGAMYVWIVIQPSCVFKKSPQVENKSRLSVPTSYYFKNRSWKV